MLHRVESALGKLMHAETQSEHCLRIHYVNRGMRESKYSVYVCMCV